MKNRNTIFTMILLVLACLALSPVAQAKPPPSEDRGNGNSAAENVEALNLSTTGSDNTAHGWFSLFSNTTGLNNTADGFQALYSNSTGAYNTATGFQALYSNTTGFSNTAFGWGALASTTTGDTNTAIGEGALLFNTEGTSNTATGVGALAYTTTGNFNTAAGLNALYTNATGHHNTAEGTSALFSNTTGINNTATGTAALLSSTTGNFNTANGSGALFNNTTGSNNIALGHNAGLNVTAADNVICIGANVAGANVSNSCHIGNIFVQTSAAGIPVFVNSDNKLGTTTSSKRFKEEIKPMDKASEALLALKPVAFRYKKEIDPAGRPQLGLVAEEVEKVNPDLVVRDKEGKPYTVRYDQVNAMLLNEFLKEHRKVEKQQATIAELKKEMDAVVARLKEQDSKIESVNAQRELSKAAPPVALNNP